ncbi:type I-E CRISPR-associated protein Cse1/CasA [Kitasatospora sp. NPDC057223]|uniref:type I-E CRISPR-associated protein Cse1/CasA n=1 Tax=Kitasatospora sp. NPDC057223 TaxID=3346055 RepID=UPI00363DC925
MFCRAHEITLREVLVSLGDDGVVWPSLRVVPGGGTEPREVSLPEVITGSPGWSGLAVEVPTMAPAVLRHMVLPVVLAALGPLDKDGWGELMGAGRFSARQVGVINGYLREHAARFDVRCFAQVPGLKATNGTTKPVTLLMPHVPSGNNSALRGVRNDEEPFPVPLAQAVRWVVHAHCWDTAAIKSGAVGDDQVKAGKTTGNPTGPLGQLGVVMPLGRTLFETIVLNLPVAGRTADDKPWWERGSLGPAWRTRPAEGVLDMWTWMSRRIALVVEDGLEGPVVRRVVVAAGERMTSVPEGEPHTTWAIKKDKKAGSVRYPRRLQVGKNAWQGLEALLALDREGAGFETSALLAQAGDAQAEGRLGLDFPLRVGLWGMVYGTQSAVVEDILADELPLPVAALRADLDVRETVIEIAEQASACARAVDALGANLRRAAGLDAVPWDKGQRPGTAVLHALDPVVRRMLTGLQRQGQDWDAVEAAHVAFEQVCAQVARAEAARLHAAAPRGVFAGREVKNPAGVKVMVREAGASRMFGAALRKALPRIHGADGDGE